MIGLLVDGAAFHARPSSVGMDEGDVAAIDAEPDPDARARRFMSAVRTLMDAAQRLCGAPATRC